MNKIWEEIVETTKYRYTKMDDELTAREFAELVGLTTDQAKNILDKKVERGEMSKREIAMDGARMNVYKPIA